ncbi:Glycosyl transferase group 1 family protein [Mucinivorans hirudinis]|uniref:Glycosyl transferase group 1 family protein n=1 Tax=Mucinivorans hirudinis TaxID=1433126 RepID=A0A060R6W0_9BACT|nr:Glycosyl transferase group 1 family protein [Mucinivorans hirudinis]
MGMKIAFISAGFRRFSGGQERIVASLANHYARAGHDVSIVCLFKSETFFPLEQSIKVYEPTINRDGNNRFLYALKIIPYIRRTVRRIKPDTMLGVGEWFNPFTVLATLGLGYPLYLTDRMSPDLRFGVVLDGAKKLFYRFSRGVIAQTSYAAQTIKRRTGVRNIIVIPNPVNAIKRTEAEKRNVIITVGRLSPEKGQEYLIRAFAKLGREDWKLSLVGDGVSREKLKALVTELDVSDSVVFHGHKLDFVKELSEAEIFVLPSLSEGFPNALIEAMSLPLACISSDCTAGPRDIIEEGVNGMLVEPANVDALAAAMEKLMYDKTLRERLSKNACRVRDELNFETISLRYLKFITDDNN